MLSASCLTSRVVMIHSKYFLAFSSRSRFLLSFLSSSYWQWCIFAFSCLSSCWFSFSVLARSSSCLFTSFLICNLRSFSCLETSELGFSDGWDFATITSYPNKEALVVADSNLSKMDLLEVDGLFFGVPNGYKSAGSRDATRSWK